MINLTDKTKEPTVSELTAYINSVVFDDLLRFANGFKAKATVCFSGDSNYPGWNLRFARGGKTLCRVYPREGWFTLLLVIGNAERARAEEMLPDMSKRMQSIYESTPVGMGQRWMMIDIRENDALYADVKRLAALRGSGK